MITFYAVQVDTNSGVIIGSSLGSETYGPINDQVNEQNRADRSAGYTPSWEVVMVDVPANGLSFHAYFVTIEGETRDISWRILTIRDNRLHESVAG